MKFKIFVLFVFLAAIIGFSIKMPEIFYDITWEELSELQQTEDGITVVLEKIGLVSKDHKMWASKTQQKLYTIIGCLGGAFVLVSLIPAKKDNT